MPRCARSCKREPGEECELVLHLVKGFPLKVQQDWHRDCKVGLPAGAVWEGAIALSHRLLKHYGRDGLKGKTVLEVGCGSAVLGMLAAQMGAERVLSTDIEEGALELARKSVERSDLMGVEIRNVRWGDIEALKGEKFDVIIGSEVTYDKELWPALWQTIRAASHSGSELWMSAAPRYMEDGSEEASAKEWFAFMDDQDPGGFQVAEPQEAEPRPPGIPDDVWWQWAAYGIFVWHAVATR